MRIRKKEKVVLILFILLLALGIGYAYLTTSLSINGTSSISRASWNIHFENIQVKSGSVTPTNGAVINADANTVTYSVTLTEPGDFYEFTVDAKNSGTIDVMISSISSKLNGTEITTLPDYLEYYVTYEDGLVIATNQLLVANTKETYKVHIGYKSNITADQLPSTDQNLNLQFTVIYSQATDDAIDVVHTKYVVSSTAANIGQAMPSGIIQYNTASEAMTSFDNLPFYLRHVVKNGIVAESYVEFVVTPTMASANEGMTAGTYALRGLGSYETNKATMLSAFGNTYCSEYSNYFRCHVSGLDTFAYQNGQVTGTDGNYYWYCYVNYAGASKCYYQD